jgi:sugar lactone lactonase YvrE
MGVAQAWDGLHAPRIARPAPPGIDNAGAATNADAVWKRAGADEGLRQAFERATYSLEDSGHGTYRGVNPAQRLTLELDGREARLSHPDGSVNFHLTGYGYGDRLRKPARATLTGTGNRVEYQRGDLTEWYVNGSQGLEQGFTLAHRPGPDRESDPLVIALGVTGELLPAQKADEDSVRFESRKGVVLRYAGLTASDARGRILPSRLEVRGREVRLIVEDREAQYPLVVDPTWAQQQELTASDGAAGDQFGYSVSVSGDTAVIGDWIKAAAYVFVRSGGVWGQQQELTASDGADFGFSVSVSGDTAVIGDWIKAAAYVFVRSGGVWSQQQKLTASDGAASDEFGWSVSVSGDTAVIGALGKTINSNADQGAAYVFVRSGGAWNQQQELIASDGASGDFFGWSVSVSGDTAVIGAYNKTINSNADQGAAYVFVRSGGVWNQQQELIASDGASGFGFSVSVSGDTAVIGASQIYGAAYVFVRSGGVWSQQQKLTASDGAGNDGFGYSVSVSGDTAVIGAVDKNSLQGAAYVFVRSGGVWSQQQELTASDGAANDEFGRSVSVSGDTAVIAALGKNSYQGAAYAFVRPRLGTSALLVGSAAGASSVVLTYSGAWTAAANDGFLHISAGSASGTGSAVVVFTYDAFTDTGTRAGTLTIAGLTVTVTQAGTNYIGPGGVTTLVSSGLSAPTGVAVDGSGNVYIADRDSNAIKEWSAATQQVTTLISTGLSHPTGVAVDGFGNLYIADFNNEAIRKWSTATQQVTTLVPGGWCVPYGLAVDGSGNVYIAYCGSNAINEWSAATQQVTTLVSSGLWSPTGVAVDGSGNVYIADSLNHAVKEWSAATQQVTALVSTGLSWPCGVAVDGSGNVYIADCQNTATKKWGAATQQVTMLSSGLGFPSGVAVDGSGNVYIADTTGNAIEEIPFAFVGPASLTEPASAGSDSLLQVLPSTTSLTGVFAPTSDQSWLTVGSISNGVIGFSFAANTSTSRTAHLTVLGQQITVTQNGLPAQTITFGTLANQLFGTAPFTVSATASSGLPASFNSQTTSVCTLSGATVTLVAVGTCTVQATQAGNSNWAAATPVNQSFQVTPGSQIITFGALSNQPLGTTPFTVGASASSGLTVSFNSQTTPVCTVSGATVTLVAVGTCTVQATQAGNTNYAAATPLSQSFQVTPGSRTSPTLSSVSSSAGTLFTYGTLTTLSVMLTPASPTPAYNGTNTLQFLDGATSLGYGTLTPSTGTFTLAGQLLNAGTHIITALFLGDANYNASSSPPMTIIVNKAPATVTLGSLSATYDGTPKSATATTVPANLAVTFTYNGNATPPAAVGSYAVVASVSDPNYTGSATGTLTISGVGITLATSPSGLLASVDGAAAQAAPFTLTLAPGAHTIAVSPVQAGAAGTQYVWTGWSDGSGAASHSITVGATPATYTAAFKTQYQLTGSASPVAGGTVTPASGTFYDAGSVVSVQAFANAGYQFANFSSGLSGTTNPQNVTMNAPVKVVANFTPLAPSLAASVGTRVDGVPGVTRLVTLTLTNTGLGAATNATIASITAIADVAGSGTVTVASGTPQDIGTIAAAASGSGTVIFNWPATATRVKFTVNFTADGGYAGSTTITTIR